jgi:hypothetical protein
MKNGNGLKKIGVALLITGPLFGLQPQAANVKNSLSVTEEKIIAAEDSTKPNEQWDSYKVDGSSSASKLVAKRSHSVSEQDETGLAIFLGVIAIGIILFFLNPFGEKR